MREDDSLDTLHRLHLSLLLVPFVTNPCFSLGCCTSARPCVTVQGAVDSIDSLGEVAEVAEAGNPEPVTSLKPEPETKTCDNEGIIPPPPTWGRV